MIGISIDMMIGQMLNNPYCLFGNGCYQSTFWKIELYDRLTLRAPICCAKHVCTYSSTTIWTQNVTFRQK